VAALERRAEELRRRFDQAFFDEQLGTYVLALDGDKRPCRVRSSNAGHVLLTEIALPERAARLVETLMAPASFTGWGIRTLSREARSYNPISYHNGSVWPHDTAIAVAGLCRYGFTREAQQIAGDLMDAAALFGGALVFTILVSFYLAGTIVHPIKRLAVAGFVAFGPDALWPLGGYPGTDDQGREMQSKLERAKINEDFVAATRFLQSHAACNGTVGVTGFCFGGGMSNYLAARMPDVVKAAVPYYGGQVAAEEARKIKGALLLHFAELDERVNAGWPAYEIALKATGVATVKLDEHLPFLGALLKREQDLLAFSERLHRTTDPSASINLNDSTVEAIGGRSYCQPWQFTLIDPPTEKELFDCMTATDMPRASR
jgi:hypothetical protein